MSSLSSPIPAAPPRSRAAGYRLVRVMGEGESSTVYLGSADSVGDEEPRRTAAVKVYRRGVAAARIDAEIAVLCAVAHLHVLDLVDVGATDDGVICAVLERCETGGLAQLIADRSSLSSGEAVTVLAPLVAAVAAVHAAGYVHRDIRLANVLFRQSGAPVLCGFGNAAAISGALTPAGLGADEAVLDDRRQLLLVVRAVLERVDARTALPVDEWLERHAVDADDFDARLCDALFDLAEPQPVRLRETVGSPVARVLVQSRPPALRERSRSPAWSAATAIAARVTQHARGVRRRYWITAAGVAASLIIAAFAVPSDEAPGGASGGRGGAQDGTQQPRAPDATSTGPPGGRSVAEKVDDTQEVDDEQASDEQASDEQASDEQSPADTQLPVDAPPPDDAAVAGDDPLAALVVLLAERQRCVRDLSVLCLDAVLQQGSAALQRDTAIIRALQAGGEQSQLDAVEANGPVLVERLGDSALLDLGDVPQTQPASALMMRGEAGWRIRDYLEH